MSSQQSFVDHLSYMAYSKHHHSHIQVWTGLRKWKLKYAVRVYVHMHSKQRFLYPSAIEGPRGPIVHDENHVFKTHGYRIRAT